MSTIIRRAFAAGILAMVALSPQAAKARFYGLSSGQTVSFTRTSDGCVISLLFDNFRAPPERPTKVPGPPTQAFTLVASPDSRGRRMSFDIKGARINAAGATIQVKIAGQQFDLRPKSDEYIIHTTARTSAASADTLVQVSLVLPDDAKAADVLLNIDSIDVSLPVCSSAGKH